MEKVRLWKKKDNMTKTINKDNIQTYEKLYSERKLEKKSFKNRKKEMDVKINNKQVTNTKRKR
jgi:hypothetical protein